MDSRLGLLFFLMSYSMFAASYKFIDGNGNRYTFTGDSSPRLVFEPVIPEHSSSGFYSGGKPKTVMLSPQDKTLFLKHVEDLDVNRYGKKIPRTKGSSLFVFEKNGKLVTLTFPYKDQHSNVLEDFLKKKLKENEEILTPESEIQKTFVIDRSESPWLGLTSSFEEEQNSLTIRAVDPKHPTLSPILTPIQTPKEILFNGIPLLYFTANPKQVVVDQNYFSELKRIDVTKLLIDEIKSIGFTKVPLKDINFVVSFLLKSQILITYWHTNSELTVVNSQVEGENTKFRIDGKHFYYTNKKNTESFSFTLVMNSVTGEITVFKANEI